ncbi:hypothetical protein SAMN04488550_2926 [Gordonia malaquae]|uniref:Uncharacterized protein n=1 Tax=Gordonia malaquae NBRC 108250 TaxID=1223542 RepID=M3VAF4_GORML|nr:hypothetical protein [Gordonia malaquae]GAC78798.1 hypothetical protein GM1_004_02430 [Gordonia malaquae NBRC 108250]SED66721.1 hypothetical protein SAMN04488550_2926 [Gordonia malaquae]
MTIRTTAAAVLALLAVLVVPWGVGTAMADPATATARATVPAAYQSLVEDQLAVLCMDRDGPDDAPCGDDAEELWKAASTCAEGGPTEPLRADEKDFIECMADEGFGEKDEEKDEQTTEQAEQMATLTLGRISASLTAFYVNALSPAADGGAEASTGLDAWAPLLSSPGMAGGFVGALDAAKGESNEWLFGRGNSANAAQIQYRAFDRDVPPETVVGEGAIDGSAPDVGTQGYLTYGATLTGLGLDTAVSPDTGVSGLLTAQEPRGYALLLAYMGTGFLDTLFDSVLEALQFLNPFRFMVDAITGEYGDGAKGELGDPVEGEPEGGFAGLQEAFGKIYSVLINIGWMLVVPILLITLGFAAVFLKQAGTGGKAKKVIIVVVFLAAGLPVFGGLYTAALTSMSSADASGARGASTKIVLSTLVDFESWVSNSRLSPPGNQSLTWDLDKHAPTGASDAAVRVSALEINSTNNQNFKSMRENRWASALSGTGFDYNWGSQVAGNQQQNADGTNTTGNRVPVGEALVGFDATRDLLMRYAKGSTVSASGFESEVKGALAAVPATDVLEWFNELSTPSALASMTARDVAALRNPLAQIDNTYGGMKAYRDGAVWSFHAGEDDPDCALDALGGGVVPSDWTTGKSPLIPCNLSIVSMYNFLNAAFGPTSMETFSPEQTLNSYSRTNHASVTAVGAGPAGMLYFVSALSVLASFVVIGFGYALAMMFSTIKRGFHLMGSVLAASVGLISGVAKVAIYTAALLLEVLGTLFLYKLVQELILLVPSILEKPLTSRFHGGIVDLGSSTGLGIAALLATLVGTIGVVVFTIMAMRLRRGLLDSIDQGATNLVNRFLATDAPSAMAPAQPGALRQGIGRGVSMGAQSMLMGSQLDGGGDAGSGDVSGDGGNPDDAPPMNGGDARGQVAAPADGAPGTNGDGSMSVDPDGRMVDAAGNPVMSKAGTPMGLDSFVPIDSSSGHLMDAPGGNEVIGADGNPIDSGDIGGFNSDGTILDADGQPMIDANGIELSSTAARQASGSLMGVEALAGRVKSEGLTAMPTTAPSSDEPTAPTPSPVATPKVLGEVPTSETAVGDDRSVARTVMASTAAGVVTSKISGGQRPRRTWLVQSGTGPKKKEG